jgi:hypothetical protein
VLSLYLASQPDFRQKYISVSTWECAQQCCHRCYTVSLMPILRSAHSSVATCESVHCLRDRDDKNRALLTSVRRGGCVVYSAFAVHTEQNHGSGGSLWARGTLPPKGGGVLRTTPSLTTGPDNPHQLRHAY